MKRNIFDKILLWDKQTERKTLVLTGAPGTGKTYLALELAKNFHDSYLYLNPMNDYRLRTELHDLITQKQPDLFTFLQKYYQIPAEWLNEFLVILDDIDYFPQLVNFIESIAVQPMPFRFMFILTQQPSQSIHKYCDVYQVTPLQFDEYLKAIGSEWYTEIIQAHFQTKKKIPEIVHKEMLNLFRDYLRLGGMPAAINEYLHTETLDNVSTIHRQLYNIFISQFNRYEDSSNIRLKQLFNSIPEQLTKENKNYRYNLIRKGATHNMYRKELQYLCDLKLVNKIERADIINNNGKLTANKHENQFRLYPNDSGILYSLIMSASSEFTDETEEESNDTPQGFLYQLLSETYLLQTLAHKNIRAMFWESGSLAKIDFITEFDSCIMPVEVKYVENKRSKSMHTFRQKFPIDLCMKFGMQNFDTNDKYIICPIYSLFCL